MSRVSSSVLVASIIAAVLVLVFKGKKGCYKSDSAHYSRVTVKCDCTLSTNYMSRTFETNLSTQIGTDSGQNILPYETQTTDLNNLNYRNSMGKPFDVQFVFNRNNKTLQIPDSAVTFTLSDADIAEDNLCLASTFRNVYDIDKKLQLTEQERVASPAVEYCFVKTYLKEPATVTMPFIGDPEKITVLKMESDHRSDSPIRRKVLKRKDDETGASNEEFYEIIGRGKLSIMTKSLSWLVCISCKKKHDFQLTGYLYGRLEPPDDSEVAHTLSASFVLYIADNIHCLDDYKQVIKDEEKKRALLHSFRLRLSEEMSLTDCIRVSLELNPLNRGWEHMKTPGCDDVLQPEEEDISLSSITGCHKSNQSGLPFAKTWYLTLVERAKKLDCIITTAQKSADQITNRDRHIVDTDILYERTPDEKKAIAGGNVFIGLNRNLDIVQPASAVQQPTSAVNPVEDPNPPVQDSAPAIRHHENDSLLQERWVRGEIGSSSPSSCI